MTGRRRFNLPTASAP